MIETSLQKLFFKIKNIFKIEKPAKAQCVMPDVNYDDMVGKCISISSFSHRNMRLLIALNGYIICMDRMDYDASTNFKHYLFLFTIPKYGNKT